MEIQKETRSMAWTKSIVDEECKRFLDLKMLVCENFVNSKIQDKLKQE